jgi:hypothetical protein
MCTITRDKLDRDADTISKDAHTGTFSITSQWVVMSLSLYVKSMRVACIATRIS